MNTLVRDGLIKLCLPTSPELASCNDMTLPQLIAIVGMYTGAGAIPAQKFLCSKSGLPAEPDGETLLLLIVHQYVRMAGSRGQLTVKGHHLAERVVKRVMEKV